MSEDRAPLPHAPDLVRKALQARMRGLLDRLGFRAYPIQNLGGKGQGIVPLNPRRQDRRPGSFVIWTDGEGAGAWKDYAIGAQGDVYDLIEYIEGLARWIDAYWWALEFLGWGRGEVRSASQEKLDRQRHEAERMAAEARLRAETEAKAAAAKAFWLSCQADIRGTVAWTYLTEARGLPLDALDWRPGALRFHPELEHYDRETGEITTWPAMVSAMSSGKGGVVRAIHRTFLAPDGSGKAPVAQAKMMKGPAEGCAVRIWKGATGLSPEAAAKAGKTSPLIITEGIEDALTAAVARREDRVWAAGSLSLIGGLDWPACASAVVLVADNDWDKPQAVAAFERVEAHWRAQAQGRPLKVVRAQAGKDLNDWARGVG